MVALILSLGVILFAVATAIALLRTRARAAQQLSQRQTEISELREQRDRASALLLSEPQVIVVWPAGADEPEITGDVTIIVKTPLARRVLAFGTLARAREGAGDGGGGRAAARRRHELHARTHHAGAELRRGRRPRDRRARGAAHPGPDRHQERTGGARAPITSSSRRDIDTVARLLEALPSPVWVRDGSGALTWVNAAYARAVEARDSADAINRNLELLDRGAREDATARRRRIKPTRRGCR